MPRQKLQAGTAAALLTIFLHSLQDFLRPGASVFFQWGCGRLPGRLHVFLLVAAGEARVPHLRMATLVLSTLALLGCVFLIYVLFHWLRDELNPRGPARPKGGRVPTLAPRGPYIVRDPHRRNF